MRDEDYLSNPPLHGRLVELHPLAEQHTEDLFEVVEDEIFRHLSWPAPRSLDELAERLAWYRGQPALTPWAQIDAASGRAIGMTTFYEIDSSLRTVAIGHTWLGRAFWRQGHNTEAKLLLLTRAFEELGCVRVVWQTDVRNERSQAAIARLGAVREGVLRKHRRRPDGSWRDTVTYAMLDDEWPAARARLTAAVADGHLPA